MAHRVVYLTGVSLRFTPAHNFLRRQNNFKGLMIWIIFQGLIKKL